MVDTLTAVEVAAHSAFFAKLVAFPFVVALIAVAVGFARSPEPRDLKRSMGPASWDFKKSWASNVTIVGSLIGSVLAIAVFKGTPAHLTREGYEAANVFWALVIAAAPATYNFFRDIEAPADASVRVTTFRGYVGGFLLATWFTTFAVIGQLATLGFIVRELAVQRVLPGTASWIFWGLLGAIAAGLLFYVVRTIGQTITFQSIHDRQRESAALELDAEQRRRRVVPESGRAPTPEEAAVEAMRSQRLARLKAELTSTRPSWPVP